MKRLIPFLSGSFNASNKNVMRECTSSAAAAGHNKIPRFRVAGIQQCAYNTRAGCGGPVGRDFRAKAQRLTVRGCPAEAATRRFRMCAPGLRRADQFPEQVAVAAGAPTPQRRRPALCPSICGSEEVPWPGRPFRDLWRGRSRDND